MYDHFTRQSKNFGYVEMLHPHDGQEAILQLDGKAINDRTLVVKPAKSRPEYIGFS
jgi:RNA recognition motif-containing protein